MGFNYTSGSISYTYTSLPTLTCRGASHKQSLCRIVYRCSSSHNNCAHHTSERFVVPSINPQTPKYQVQWFLPAARAFLLSASRNSPNRQIRSTRERAHTYITIYRNCQRLVICVWRKMQQSTRRLAERVVAPSMNATAHLNIPYILSR